MALQEINIGASANDGSGDPLRTAMDKVNENFALLDTVFNVKDPDYGALGNGANDDTAEIQAAINAAEAAGGGVVLFPPGTYLVDSTLTIDSPDVILRGAGRNVTTLAFKAAASGSRILSISADNIVIEGFTLDGDNAASTSLDFIRFSSANRCVFEKNRVINAPGTALGCLLLFTTAKYNRIAFNEFEDCVGSGVGLSGASVQHNDVIYNSFTDCGGFGIRVGDGASKNLLEKNRTESNTLELIGVTYQSHENRLIGNHAEGCGDNGISITGNRNVCADNVCTGNDNAGIWVWGSSNSVKNNVLLNNVQGGGSWFALGISPDFGGLGCWNTVSGNIVDDTQAVITQRGFKISSLGYTLWANGQAISSVGTFRYYGLNLYTSTNTGTTGATPPTHTTGTQSDGTVSWAYVDSWTGAAESRYNEINANTIRRVKTDLSAPYSSVEDFDNNLYSAAINGRLEVSRIRRNISKQYI